MIGFRIGDWDVGLKFEILVGGLVSRNLNYGQGLDIMIRLGLGFGNWR